MRSGNANHGRGQTSALPAIRIPYIYHDVKWKTIRGAKRPPKDAECIALMGLTKQCYFSF